MSVLKLTKLIQEKQNFLCVGLDPDLDKMPIHIPKTAAGVVSFVAQIIAATKDDCVAYKVNFAFFEALGREGWYALQETRNLLPNTHFLIADAKRGDIGNTAKKYAESIFGDLDFDAVTLSPYMGKDVVDPFLAYENKTVILLALTSNKGSLDFQLSRLENGQLAFEQVIEKSATWASADRLMYVVGATKPEYFEHVRRYAPKHTLLVPGVGAQGGSLELVYQHGKNNTVGLLVNSSRGIIYAGLDKDFAVKAGEAAKSLCKEMKLLLTEKEY